MRIVTQTVKKYSRYFMTEHVSEDGSKNIYGKKYNLKDIWHKEIFHGINSLD